MRAQAHDRIAPRWWELALIVAAAVMILSSLIVFYDDVHRVTTNGLAKSVDVARWVERSPDRATDPGNLLYYPVIATLVRALPESTFGQVWQRMAYVNALFGAGVLALTYMIGVALFRARGPALFACAAQLSMAFFLLLATINEDIMPGYFWFVAAVACVLLPRRLGPAALLAAAQCVALSWLFHSSLQLPGIGAFLVGIIGWTGSLRRALWPMLLFCAALLPLPVLSALWFGVPWWQSLAIGKGIGTGWGGFSANKLVFVWSGISQSVAGGLNISTIQGVLSSPNVLITLATSLVVAVLFVVWLREGRRQRALPEWRIAVSVLSGVFVLGELMNLYIQPQDPQMQIQPMTWFPFAVASVYRAAGMLPSGAAVIRTSLVAAAVALTAFNLRVHVPTRHGDSIALRNIETVEALVQPKKTVFLLHGFEGMCTWLMMAWGAGFTDQPVFHTDGPPRFNAIFVASQATVTPHRSAEISAREVVWLVDQALDEGFDVVAGDIWAAPEEFWVDSFATISGPDKPRAIRAALHERFTGAPIGELPAWTRLYRLTRKPDAAP